MSTMSWTKIPLIILFATGITAACGDDDTGGKKNPATGECGNGVIDGDEDCDGDGVLGGATCASTAMGATQTGTLACSATCTFDRAGCRTAGGGTGGSGSGGRPPTTGGAPTSTGGMGGPDDSGTDAPATDGPTPAAGGTTGAGGATADASPDAPAAAGGSVPDASGD